MKKCLRKDCVVEFQPSIPKQKFCSPICRVYYKRDLMPKKKRGRPPKIEQKINVKKPTELPQTNFIIDTRNEIEKYEAELLTIGSGQWASIRKNFLNKKIYELKKNIK